MKLPPLIIDGYHECKHYAYQALQAVGTHLKDYSDYYFTSYACLAVLFATYESGLWLIFPFITAILFRYLTPFMSLLIINSPDKDTTEELAQQFTEEFDIVFIYTPDAEDEENLDQWDSDLSDDDDYPDSPIDDPNHIEKP